jgi:hypothetical protein
MLHWCKACMPPAFARCVPDVIWQVKGAAGEYPMVGMEGP